MPNHMQRPVTHQPQHDIHHQLKQLKGPQLAPTAPGVRDGAQPPPDSVDQSYLVATVGDANLEVVERNAEIRRTCAPRYLSMAEA
jgi:hypothetical protein